MSVLICGSMAYDHIMVFKDRFKNHILPDKMHILNVSFLVPEIRFWESLKLIEEIKIIQFKSCLHIQTQILKF